MDDKGFGAFLETVEDLSFSEKSAILHDIETHTLTELKQEFVRLAGRRKRDKVGRKIVRMAMLSCIFKAFYEKKTL